MDKTFNCKKLLFFSCLLFFANSIFAQYVVEAGINQTICPGATINIGGTPTAAGGKPPYKFGWSSSDGVFIDSVSNPSVSPTDFTSYYLSIVDDTGAFMGTDVVNITVSYILYINAGEEKDYCLGGSSIIGGPNNATGIGISYYWTPSIGLNDTTSPRPTASPLITTEYTLTATIAGCPPKIDSVIITVIQPPPINAGNDITIKEGETTILHASGGFFYEWSPNYLLLYNDTDNPDAEPVVTTSYYLYGFDEAKRCDARDTVTVFVEPSDDIVIYNTFTPNADGNNDTWYIGNIQKYPNNSLEIFNRNGKLVYKMNGYANSWDGESYIGGDLPETTYFYVLDLKNGKDQFHGTITIVNNNN